MANKPFAIQGADLTLGGVNIQAGTTGVVVPGVTQAVNFRVKEVDEMPNIGGQDLGDDAGAITVIDNAEYLYLVDDGDSPSADYVAATYSVDDLDELGNIKEIDVETEGVFLAADKTRVEAANMWATLDPTPFVSFSAGNWIQIPFRPKMRAGEVENIGGGGADTGNFTFNEDTITNSDGMKLTTNRGTLAMGTNMETPGVAQHFHIAFDGSNSNPPASDLFLGDDNNYVKLPGYELNPTAQFGVEIGTDNRNLGPQNIEVGEVDELVPPGGVWRLFIDHEDYPNLGSAVSVGDTVTTSWGTPITATITDVVEEPGNWWKIHVAQDITAGFLDEGETVSFGLPSGGSHVWRFGTDGALTAPGDIKTGVDGGRFIQDCDDGTTSMRWINVEVDDDSTQLIRAYSGDPDGEGNSDERAQIKLNWQDEDRSGLTIRAFDRTDPEDTVSHDWNFSGDGDLYIPPGKTIRDAMTGDDLLAGGGTAGDANIWVQTFESETGAPTDIVAIAISVEYDSAGNVIALFSHYNDNAQGTYYSVGKYTTAGVKIWTARFADGVETDGWGLAVSGNYIYVAGQTLPSSESGYSVSTLTKLNSSDGTIEWSKTYDFGYASNSQVVDVASDGDPVMVGYASNGTDDYVATTKVDAEDGSIIWSRALNGQADEEAYGMAVGPTGEIVAIGYMEQLGLGSTNAVATVVTVPSSNPNWTTQYGGGDGTNENYQDIIFDIIVTDGVPAITIKTDPVGNRTIGDTIMTLPGDSFGGVNGVDDMVVNVASVSSTAGSQDNHMLVVKYDSTGSIQWQKAILFDEDFDCRGADADIDSEGNIYVTGSYQYESENLGGGFDTAALSILKLDSTGTKQWSRRVTGTCDTFGVSVVVGADDKLYLSGVTGFAGYTGGEPDLNNGYTWVAAKYGFDGTVEWQRLIDHTDSWSFAGETWNGLGGGSNLAVKDGYVVLGGGFGSLANSENPRATVVQVSATGDTFATGPWAFTAATFSGVLNSSASDITVSNAVKTDTDNASNISVATVNPQFDSSDFLIGTLYTVGGSDRLFNGGSELVLSSTGTVTLPLGGTITEGIVTSNPTIQLTPATPDVASQKLVIKGGSNYNFTDNGITLSYQDNTALVGDTLEFYINGASNYNNQTLYWWIYPENANLTTPSSGTIAINGTGGSVGPISFVVDNDDYEFTVRVSPENNNYDPANVGVESGLINADAPTFDSPYHLHLTTGNLAETSIFLGTDNHNVRTTVDGGIQVTTETTVPLVPPITIVISGADVAAVNLTYLIAPMNPPTWVPAGGNMAIDPYIQFANGEYGIVAPGYDPVIPLYVNTGTLNVPVAQWNTNPPYGSVAPTGAYTYSTTDVYEWTFGADGTTTFPTLTVPISDNANPSGTGQTLKFSDSSQQAIIFGPVSTADNNSAERIIIQGAPGFDGTGGEGGDVYVWAGPGGSLNGQGGDIKVRAGQGDGTGSGGYLNFQAGDSATGNGGYINIESGQSDTYGLGGDITVRAQSGGEIYLRTRNSNGTNNDWLFGANSALTLPGAVVNSTVAKTGVADLNANDMSFEVTVVDGSGVVTEVTITNTPNIAWQSNGAGTGVTVGDLSFTVQVDGSGNATVSGITSSGGHSIGETFTTGGDSFGAEILPTAIDLTKSINKLTDGFYTLANGVEGQIMYLVAQNGVVEANVSVLVANSRNIGVSTLSPFSVYDNSSDSYYDNIGGICTLIFTDGAWQQTGGAWGTPT